MSRRLDEKSESLMGTDGSFVEAVDAFLRTGSALDATYVAQKCSANVGFDFQSLDLVVDKVREELREVLEAFERREADPGHFAEEIGDCFFVLVNLCRHVGLDPEELLRSNVEKYLERCRFVEAELHRRQKGWRDAPLDMIYQLWREAKEKGL